MDKLDIKSKGLIIKGKINISLDAIRSRFKTLIGEISEKDLKLMKVYIAASIASMGVTAILNMPGVKIDTISLGKAPNEINNMLDDFKVDAEIEKEMIRKAAMLKLALDLELENNLPLEADNGQMAPELDADNNPAVINTAPTYSLNSEAITSVAALATQKLNDKYKSLLLEEEDYIIDSNMDRYISYYKRNPDLSTLEVIARVNVNLDYSVFEKIENVPVPNSPLALVNKFYRLPNEYVPEGYPVANSNGSKDVRTQYLSGEAGKFLDLMVGDAKKTGLTITKESGYRSYNYQYTVYWKKSVGEKNLTDKQKDLYQKERDQVSARAGLSEHQNGLVMDVNNGEKWCLLEQSFEKTEEFMWLRLHAHEYGFILRYPKGKENITGYNYEPWHYRYVGKKIAKVIYESNLTYEEFYGLYIAPIAVKDKSALNLDPDEFFDKYIKNKISLNETKEIIADANAALREGNSGIQLEVIEDPQLVLSKSM